MRNHCFRLLLPVFLFAVPLSAQNKIAVGDLRADLTFLQEALYHGHPGVFLFNTKDSLDDFFGQLRSRLHGDSVPYEQAQVSVRLALARIRDGHTTLETPFYDDSTRVLPLTTQVLGERVYVLGNYSGDTTLQRGSELLAVNGEPVADVVRIGRLLSCGDGYNRTFNDAIASVYFARYRTLLFGTRPVNQVTISVRDGPTAWRRIAAKTRADLLELIKIKVGKPHARKPLLHYKDMQLWRDTARSDLAILRIGDFPNGQYKKFYRRSFRLLADNKIGNLVIDLRYNTGGNIHNMDYLVSCIVDQRFGYRYERLRHTRMGPYFNWKASLIKGLTWMRYNLSPGYGCKRQGDLRIHTWNVKPRKRDNFNGKVLVLTNGWSFSSASMCASFLKNRSHAITIGTETGGNEAGNCGGGYPKLILPNTKFKIRFPLYHLRYDIGKPDVGRGVLPDYPTPYRMEDILEKKDLEMEMVYELLRQ